MPLDVFTICGRCKQMKVEDYPVCNYPGAHNNLIVRLTGVDPDYRPPIINLKSCPMNKWKRTDEGAIIQINQTQLIV